MAQTNNNPFELECEAVGHVQLLANQVLSTTEDEYLQGYHGAQRNVDESNNPFAPNSRAYQNWNDGWWDGFYNEEARFVTQTENIIPFPVITQNNEKVLASTLPAFVGKLAKKWQHLNPKVHSFKQSKTLIFLEVFAVIFFIGLAYELVS